MPSTPAIFAMPSICSGAFISFAFCQMTLAAAGVCLAEMTGMPGLIMPAFSVAMAVRLLPKKCSWSWAMGVMTEAATASGASTLVASIRPPSPTSSKRVSAGWRAKAKKAVAVVISKNVMVSLLLAVSASHNTSARAVSEMSVPLSRIRSLNRTKWGEV